MITHKFILEYYGVYSLQALHVYIRTHSLWIVTSVVAFSVNSGVLVVDRQVYCPPWDVCRELNVRVRVVVKPVVL